MYEKKSYNHKKDKAIEVFSKEKNSLRTGKTKAGMLDIVKELSINDLKIKEFYRIKIGE